MQRRNFKAKPHRCPHCSKHFSLPGGLTQHVKHKHTVPLALQKLGVEELEENHWDHPVLSQVSPPSSSIPPEERRAEQQPQSANTFKPPTRTEHHPILDGMGCILPFWNALPLTLTPTRKHLRLRRL